MQDALAFLFSTEDAHSFLHLTIPDERVHVWASGADTMEVLKEQRVPYSSLVHFLPLSVTKHNYVLTDQLAERCDPSIYGSVRFFLLELLRSVTIAKRMLREHPKRVFVGDIRNESPFQRYHSASFNLLPQAIIAWCRAKQIPITVLGRSQPKGSLFRNALSQFFSSISLGLSSRKYQHQSTNGKGSFIISATEYHLRALQQFILIARRKGWGVVLASRNQIQMPIRSLSGIRGVKTMTPIWSMQDALSIFVSTWLSCAFSLLKGSSIVERKLRKQLGFDVWPMFQKDWYYWHFVLIPQGKLYGVWFSKLLQILKPRIFISSNSIDNFNRILHRTAQKYGVPDVVIQHYPMSSSLDVLEEQCGIQSALCVAGPFSLKLMHHLEKKFKIFLTGLPMFDQYRHAGKQGSQIIRHHPIRILFLARQELLFLQNPNTQIIQEALNELRRCDHSIAVTIRQHPDDSPLKLHEPYRFQIRFSSTTLTEDLRQHDIVITQATTAAYDAMFLGKPLIYLNTQCVKNFRPFATAGAALGVYKKTELIPALESLIARPRQLAERQQAFLRDVCFKRDGHASERVARVIERIGRIS